MGGFLSNAADKYTVFDVPWIRAFPYALPMVIVAGVCMLATLMGCLFLEETVVGGGQGGSADGNAATDVRSPGDGRRPKHRANEEEEAGSVAGGVSTAGNAAQAAQAAAGAGAGAGWSAKGGSGNALGGSGQHRDDGLAGGAEGGGTSVSRSGIAGIFKETKPFWATVLYAIISFVSSSPPARACVKWVRA